MDITKKPSTTSPVGTIPDDWGEDTPAVPTDARTISRVLSPKERLEDQERKRTKSSASRTTLLYRNVRRNPDLVFWGLALFLCVSAGYLIARIKYGVTTDELSVGVADFVEFIVVAVSAVVFAVAKLFAKVGPVVESLKKRGNKDENLDEYGRTIVGK